MKTNLMFKLLTLCVLTATLGRPAFAQGTTAFTFQGRLNTASGAANGSYDMTFAVWDANVAGNLIAGPITNSAVAVSNGLFTVSLDFGPGVFTGTNYWVQMAVGTNGSGSFATLVPRQQLSPTPYALYAPQAGSLAPSASQANALCPAGSVTAFAGANVPSGWLLCDGSAVSRTAYASLFAAVGTAWGTGDGATTFNLPDMRGVFLRGVDSGRGQDPDTGSRSATAGGNSGDAVGSYQADMFASHTHSFQWGGGGITGASSPYQVPIYNQGFNNTFTTSAAGGSETRPKNVYVNYIIKY